MQKRRNEADMYLLFDSTSDERHIVVAILLEIVHVALWTNKQAHITKKLDVILWTNKQEHITRKLELTLWTKKQEHITKKIEAMLWEKKSKDVNGYNLTKKL